MVLPFLFPLWLILGTASLEQARNLAAENVLRLIQIRLATPSLAKISTTSQDNSATTNRRLGFQKRAQLFIRSRNKTLSVAAMRVCNPDRSPAGINR